MVLFELMSTRLKAGLAVVAILYHGRVVVIISAVEARLMVDGCFRL